MMMDCASPLLMQSSPATMMKLSLNLRHLRVGPKILNSLQTKTELEELWLGPTFASQVNVELMVQSLSALKKLKHLDLDLSHYGWTRASRSSCGNSSNTTTVTEIDWETELKTLFAGLPPSIRDLSLRLPTQEPKSVEALAHALPLAHSLKSLDLRGNQLGNSGATALAQVLAGTKLKAIHLSWNRIGPEGATALAQQALAVPTCALTRLNLSHNDTIDDAAMNEFCMALRSNVHLKELNLFSCHKITEVGLQCLVECLQHYNTTLEHINFKASPAMTMGIASNCNDKNVLEEVEYWLSLNRAGRRLLYHTDQESSNDISSNTRQIPFGLWAHVLAKKPIHSDFVSSKQRLTKNSNHQSSPPPNELYFLLRQQPQLLLATRRTTANRNYRSN